MQIACPMLVVQVSQHSRNGFLAGLGQAKAHIGNHIWSKKRPGPGRVLRNALCTKKRCAQAKKDDTRRVGRGHAQERWCGRWVRLSCRMTTRPRKPWQKSASHPHSLLKALRLTLFKPHTHAPYPSHTRMDPTWVTHSWPGHTYGGPWQGCMHVRASILAPPGVAVPDTHTCIDHHFQWAVASGCLHMHRS